MAARHLGSTRKNRAPFLSRTASANRRLRFSHQAVRLRRYIRFGAAGVFLLRAIDRRVSYWRTG